LTQICRLIRVLDKQIMQNCLRVFYASSKLLMFRLPRTTTSSALTHAGRPHLHTLPPARRRASAPAASIPRRRLVAARGPPRARQRACRTRVERPRARPRARRTAPRTRVEGQTNALPAFVVVRRPAPGPVRIGHGI